jgi:Zn-dependent protease with chaperone function
MGILSFIMSRLWRAKPFQSDLLDRLAETMLTTEILKARKMQRYYRVKSLQAGCLSYSDAIFFDSKYCDMLLPEELLAVGAHEFNHIIKRHKIKKIKRQILPALVIGILLGLLAFFNYDFINHFIIFHQVGRIPSSMLVAAISFVLLLFASFYFNAKWLRQQETQSDLCAVKFADGEALISALIKLNKLYPKKLNGLESRFLPKTYPTIEERMDNIRAEIDRKTSEEN